MFAYCGNNPVNCVDRTGEISTFVAVCSISSVISGLSNAISTAFTGGTLKECLIAGACGAVGGAVGAAVGIVLPIDPLRKGIIGRGVATIITDLSTSVALNSKITAADVAWAVIDTTMDITFSTMGYFYNPINEVIRQTTLNASVDAGTDIAQILLFADKSKDSNLSASLTENREKSYQLAHAKVGQLLGIA